MCEQGITLGSGACGGFAGMRDLVVAARRSLAGRRLVFGLPFGFDQAVTLQPAERRIHGAAGQTCGLHNVEAKAIAEAERLEDEGRAVREAGSACHAM